MTILKVFMRLVIKIKNGFIFISPAIHHFENYLSVCSFKDFIHNADSVSPLVTDAKRQRYLVVIKCTNVAVDREKQHTSVNIEPARLYDGIK